MKQVFAITAVFSFFMTGVQARADGQRCKVDSSGRVVASQTSQFNDRFCGLVDRVVQAKKKNNLANRLKVEFDPSGGGGNTGLFIDAILINHNTKSPDADKIEGKFLSQIEESRVDKQLGASSGSSGTTSLTSKGSVPEILGFAVENGALTQSQSGTTVTFSGNPVGIIKALGNKGYLQGYADDDPLTRRIRDFTFGVSFDTSRGNTQGNFTGDAQQVSSYSFRYAILNHRDPRSNVYRGRWQALAEGPGTSATIDENRIFMVLADQKKDPNVFRDWLKTTQEEVSKAASGTTTNDQDLAGKVEQVVSDQLFVELSKKQDQLTDLAPSLLTAYSQSEAQFLNDRQSILDLASKGSILTFEYVNDRQLKASDISNFKFIAEGNAGTKVDLTANLAFAVLNQIPLVEPSANRLQDVLASAEVDVRAGDVAHLGSVVLTMSGMYKRQLNNTITSTGTVTPNTKGDFAVGQFKITIPVKGSGVKIPFSFSVANRTDLIKETDVRGSFGFTFDLDSIFAKASP